MSLFATVEKMRHDNIDTGGYFNQAKVQNNLIIIATIPDGLEESNILSVRTTELLDHEMKRREASKTITLFLNAIIFCIYTSIADDGIRS